MSSLLKLFSGYAEGYMNMECPFFIVEDVKEDNS